MSSIAFLLPFSHQLSLIFYAIKAQTGENTFYKLMPGIVFFKQKTTLGLATV